ncbi:MAG: hypothetical protein K5651_04955 [Bacteroidales bacterium]|nr:hypothetical protein [Bacteroidales bacterium]
MKKLFVLLFASAALFSCAKIAEPVQDENASSAPSIITTFVASSENIEESRASVNPSTGAVGWEAGDAILVSNGIAQAVYAYDESDGLFHNEDGLANTGNFQAWYPASAITLTESGAQVTLPDTQVYDASAIRSAPMYAASTSTQLNFKNLCAILRFKINGGHSLSNLVFTSATKGVAGAAVIADNALTLSSDDTKTLTLTTAGATLGAETPFYLVLPAQLYTGGFSLQINCSDGWQFEKATTNDLPLHAGVIDGMKAFDAKLFSGGGGTDDNPFQIATEQDLLDLATYMNGSDHDYFADKSYLQTESITLTTANFTPIGNNADHSFYGHFDGNAKTIYDLKIDASSSDNRGLFGCMSAGTIEDVHINATGNGYSVISGKANVGAIVGRLAGGTIKNCGFGRTQVIGTGNNCGIVAGYVPGPNVLLQNNSIGATCSVTGNTQIGGIAGRINRDCVIEACEVKACSVTGVSRVGGVLGYMEENAIVNACSSGAKVSATTASAVVQSGGVVGYMLQSKTSSSDVCTVINCIYAPDVNKAGATITIQSSYANYLYVGGIVGAAATGSGAVGSLAIVNCYSYPTLIKNTNSDGFKGVGGILGGTNTASTTVFNCYSPMMMSNFYLKGATVNVKNYSNFGYIGSIVGYPYASMTMNGVYGRQTLRLYNTGTSCNTTNISSSVADPAMKNFDNVIYHTSYSSTVASYATFKQALDAGADSWNATNPAVRALYWTADVRADGYLKPDGVYKPSTNVYKRVSIIGDSISTYRSYIFEDQKTKYNPYYPNSWTEDGNTVYGDILREQNTWWWKLIYNKMTNARLEVNNAYSGSSCCYIDANTPNYSSHNVTDAASTTYSFRNRYRTKGIGNPDVVIMFGGRNDFGKYGGMTDDYLGSYTDASLEVSYQGGLNKSYVYRDYSAALTGLITEISVDHPNTKFLILCHDMISDGFEAADNAIATFLRGKGLDVKCVSFHETGTKNKTNTTIGITKDHGSSCHPDNAGATAMANYIYSQVGDWLDQ